MKTIVSPFRTQNLEQFPKYRDRTRRGCPGFGDSPPWRSRWHFSVSLRMTQSRRCDDVRCSKTPFLPRRHEHHLRTFSCCNTPIETFWISILHWSTFSDPRMPSPMRIHVEHRWQEMCTSGMKSMLLAHRRPSKSLMSFLFRIKSDGVGDIACYVILAQKTHRCFHFHTTHAARYAAQRKASRNQTVLDAQISTSVAIRQRMLSERRKTHIHPISPRLDGD